MSDLKRCLLFLVAAVLLAGGCAQTQVSESGVVAARTNDFLDSLGINATMPNRGQPLDKTIEMIDYTGFRWMRGGTEGLTEDGPTTLQTYLDLHEATGVKFSWGPGSTSTDEDLITLIETAKPVAEAGALLAFEGNNEPNNWGVTYHGEDGGGKHGASWIPVAKLQRDLYAMVKADPLLRHYAVWSVSENGGEADNVGLQYLLIPPDADTLMPVGTRYADYANVHNYIYHPEAPGLEDNKTWNCADPTPDCKVDGLAGNYGTTWWRKFPGYSVEELKTLPRVTTETGATIGGGVTEDLHGKHQLTLFLAQYKRGYSYTSTYILRDRTDEAGNQRYGFYNPDYSPRKAAVYMHNFTTILADDPKAERLAPGELRYAIPSQPDTVHDLLLQRSDGVYQLVVWAERVRGEDHVTVHFAEPAKQIKIFDPTIGTDPIRTRKNVRSLKLALSDHPVVVELPQ